MADRDGTRRPTTFTTIRRAGARPGRRVMSSVSSRVRQRRSTSISPLRRSRSTSTPQQETSPGSGIFNDLDGLTIVIEQLVGTTWTEIHRDTTDSSGQFYYSAASLGRSACIRRRGIEGEVPRLLCATRATPTTPSADARRLTLAAPARTSPSTSVSTRRSCRARPRRHLLAGHTAQDPVELIRDRIVCCTHPDAHAQRDPDIQPLAVVEPELRAEPELVPDVPPTVNQGFDLWWLWIVLAVIVALILFFLARLLLGRRP